MEAVQWKRRQWKQRSGSNDSGSGGSGSNAVEAMPWKWPAVEAMTVEVVAVEATA